MNVRVILVITILLSGCVHPRKAEVARLAEHMAIGAATEVGISQLAGGSQKVAAGVTAAAAVAVAKEGSDYHNKKDSLKMAIIHAIEIVAGAGAAVAIKH